MKIFFYFLAKYFLFYSISMVESNNFSMLKINEIKNGADLFYYFWLVLFFPIVKFVIFVLPIIYSFDLRKQKSILLNLFLIIILIYIYFTSQKYILDSQTLVLFLSSIICFAVFFNKEVKIYSKKISNEKTIIRQR